MARQLCQLFPVGGHLDNLLCQDFSRIHRLDGQLFPQCTELGTGHYGDASSFSFEVSAHLCVSVPHPGAGVSLLDRFDNVQQVFLLIRIGSHVLNTQSPEPLAIKPRHGNRRCTLGYNRFFFMVLSHYFKTVAETS